MAVIVIDFDGTIVDSKYPIIGKIKPDAKRVINKLYNRGHKIVINSCRAGTQFSDAFNFLLMSGINFHTFNENLQELIDDYGRDTRKISGDVYIDDKNLATLYINWNEIEFKLKAYHNIV